MPGSNSKIQTIIAAVGSYRSRGRDLEAPGIEANDRSEAEITLIAFPRNWLRDRFSSRRNAPRAMQMPVRRYRYAHLFDHIT